VPRDDRIRHAPPAHLDDFDAIPGQREAWDAYVSESLLRARHAAAARLGALARACRPQFRDATQDAGHVPTTRLAVAWSAFPRELLKRFGRERALAEGDRTWPLCAYQLDWRFDPDSPLPGAAARQRHGAYWPAHHRYRPTTEYCEWHVARDPATGRPRRIAFTCEPPEYWQALFGGRLAGSQVVFPGDRERLLALYRRHVDPRVAMEDLLARPGFASPFGDVMTQAYNPWNRWNTTHGAMHLTAPPNALLADVFLAAYGTLRFEDGDGRDVTSAEALLAGAGFGGGPNRASDPAIVGTVNALARLGRAISLADPVGIAIERVDTAGWELPGGLQAADCVHVERGGPGGITRLVVAMPTDEHDLADLRIGGVPVTFGGQVAECVAVRLHVDATLRDGEFTPGRLRLPEAGAIDPCGGETIHTPLLQPRPPGMVRAFAPRGQTP